MGLGGIAAGAAIAGTAVSAYGAIESGQAQAASLNYQAQIAANNAKIAQDNSTRAIQAGQVAAEAESRKGAARQAALRAAEAANGVDVNSGSSLDVQESERRTNALDTQTVMNNALLKAYGYRTQSGNFQAQSALDTAGADQAVIGSAFKASSTLLGGASSIGGKWGGGSASADDFDVGTNAENSPA